MDFSDTLYVAPAAPRTDAPAPANAAPAAGSGEKSEFAAKLAESNRSDSSRTETKSEAKADARPADGNSEAPAARTPARDSADASGAANTAAQAAAAPVQAASQPVRVTPAAILLQLNAVQPEGAADNNTFNPTFPVGIDPATQQLTAHSGAAQQPQSTTLPIAAAKKGDAGVTIESPANALETLAKQTAPTTETVPTRAATAAPLAAAALVAAPVVATPAVIAATSQPTQLAAAAPVVVAAATPAPAAAVATPAPTKAAAPSADAKSAAPDKDAKTGLTADPSDKVAADTTPSTGGAKTVYAQPATQASQSGSGANSQSNAQSGAQTNAQTNAQVAIALDAATQAAPTPDAAAAPVAPIADASLTTSASSSSSSSSAAATPAALQDAPAAVAQVYTRFIERNDGRAQRFEVRLDPAELGRVDVRIEVGADHKVHAVLAAHDSAALSDLMRGQRSLERALGDAGVDLADNGLSFELASDSRSGFAGQQGSDAQSGADLAHAWRGFDTTVVPVDVDANVMAAASRPWRTSRLDLVA